MICPRCRKEINDDVSYCPECGMKIERCPSCYKPIIQGAQYCSYCGQALHNQYQEHIGGYYQPIDDYHNNQQENTSFNDVKTGKKVNNKILIIGIIVVALLTGISMKYIKSTQNQNVFNDNETINETIEVKGSISDSTRVGNINQSSHVDFYNDRIYMIDDSGNLVSMDSKLQDQKTLINGTVEYIQVINDLIYYTDENNHLCSVNLEGKEQKTIIDKKVYYPNIKEDKIYYQLDDDSEKIYVYDLKTNENTKINDRKSYNINVIDNYIYYTSTDGIYRVGINGQGDEKLISDKSYNLICQDKKLYYTTSDNQVKCYDIDKQEISVVIEEVSQLMNLTDHYLFYYSQEGLKKYDLSSKESQTIYNGLISYCEILGDKLVITTYGDSGYRVIMDYDGVNQQRVFMATDGSYI